MNNPIIVMLLGFLPNHRLLRRIELEKEIGTVHLICWDRGADMMPPPSEKGITVHIINIPAGSDPLKRLVPTRKFSQQATQILKQIKPQIIHVQGLDMLQIAASFKNRSKTSVKIIYEVADLHRYIIDNQKDLLHKLVKWYLVRADRRLEKSYEFLIETSEAFYDTYFKEFVPRDKVLYMPNMPDLSIYDSYKKKKEGDFTIGYIGGVRYKKQIHNLIEAARICKVKLLIAGFEDEPVELEPICKADPNIEWVGRFNYAEQAPLLYGKCDVMYSVYDADMANVRVALPNKLYESVYCEMPIIVAKDTYLAEVVERWGVGLAVDHRTSDELIEAIGNLKNKKVMDLLVNNCIKQKRILSSMKPNDSFVIVLSQLAQV